MKTTTIQTLLRILLGAFMLVAGIGHLTFLRDEFTAQVPSFLKSSRALTDFVVVASGVIEIVFGLCMIFLVNYKVKVGIALAIFFILIFPGNVAQYVNEADGFGLDTNQKRLTRLFFQPVLIIWALWSTGALKFWIERRKK